jgi:hypothetical protein
MGEGEKGNSFEFLTEVSEVLFKYSKKQFKKKNSNSLHLLYLLVSQIG